MPESPEEKAIREFLEQQKAELEKGKAAAADSRTGRTTTTNTSRDFNAEERSRMLATGWPSYAFERDLPAKGFVKLGENTYVNPKTGDKFNRDASQGDIFVAGFRASATERGEANRIAQAGGGQSALNPTARDITLGRESMPGGALFRSDAAREEGRLANIGLGGRYVNIGDTMRNLRDREADTSNRNQQGFHPLLSRLDERYNLGRQGQVLSGRFGGPRGLEDLRTLPYTPP